MQDLPHNFNRNTHPVNPGVPPPLQGSLWDWYRQLYREGWKLDASSYSTCFR